MKATSIVLYTFEDKEGNAETYNKNDFDEIVKKESIQGYTRLELEGEGETIKVPMLAGYKKPYDSAVTDEIGTEHYIFYEETEEEQEPMETVKDIKRMLGVIKEDIRHKESYIMELDEQGRMIESELLKAEVRGMQGVIQDIEQAL